MMARSELLSCTSEPVDDPDLHLSDPAFVALMFLLGLGDPTEFDRGLKHLVTPGSQASWGDFTVVADQLNRIAPWKVHGFTAHDAADDDVAYVQVRASPPPSPDGAMGGAGKGQIITLVRLDGHGSRWFVHDFGRPSRQAGSRRRSRAFDAVART